jgi:hypothetical protein
MVCNLAAGSSPLVQWVRLALYKGPNRVGLCLSVSLRASPKDGSIQYQNVVF